MPSLAAILRDRVTIEEEVDTDNGQGGQDAVWRPLGGAGAPGSSVAAEVYGLSGGEAMRAGVERAMNQWRVTIRRRDAVTAKHRLQWIQPGGGAVQLEIVSAMRHPKWPRAATLLMCESGV